MTVCAVSASTRRASSWLPRRPRGSGAAAPRSRAARRRPASAAQASAARPRRAATGSSGVPSAGTIAGTRAASAAGCAGASCATNGTSGAACSSCSATGAPAAIRSRRAASRGDDVRGVRAAWRAVTTLVTVLAMRRVAARRSSRGACSSRRTGLALAPRGGVGVEQRRETAAAGCSAGAAERRVGAVGRTVRVRSVVITGSRGLGWQRDKQRRWPGPHGRSSGSPRTAARRRSAERRPDRRCTPRAPRHVAPERVELLAQVLRAALERLGGVEHVGHTEAGGGARHQLREAASTGRRAGVRVEAGLLLDQAGEQRGVEPVLLRGGGDLGAVRDVGGQLRGAGAAIGARARRAAVAVVARGAVALASWEAKAVEAGDGVAAAPPIIIRSSLTRAITASTLTRQPGRRRCIAQRDLVERALSLAGPRGVVISPLALLELVHDLTLTRRLLEATRRASTSASWRSRSRAASRRSRSARSMYAWAAIRSTPAATGDALRPVA